MIRPAQLIKLFACFLVTCYLLLVTCTPALAQTYNTPNTEAGVPKNLNSWTQNVLIETVNSINCQLIGVNIANPTQKCLGVNPKTGQIGFVENGGGLIGASVVMISSLYTPPASSIDYINYLSHNFGIVKPTYAAPNYPQGFGFASITPIAKIWSVFRDIVYMLFVIVFIIIGVAVMLRIHIDPRTVMSVENQIPKVIVALVMITFSFSIAGFLIDAMWVSIYVTTNVIASADSNLSKQIATVNNELYTPAPGFTNEILQEPGGNTTGGIIRIAAQGGRGVQMVISKLFAPKDFNDTFKIHSDTMSACTNILNCTGAFVKDFIGKTVGTVLSQIIGWVASWVLGSLAVLVFTIAILVAMFRLWISLLQAYIFLLLDIVLAPFWILASLFPGSPLSIGAWFRELLAQLSAFVVTIALLLLGKVFMDAFQADNLIDSVAKGATGQYAPPAPFPVPLIGNPGEAGTLSALIGIGIILLAPQATAMTKALFKAPDFKYTQAIGQSLGAGTGFVGNVTGGVWERLWKVDAQHRAVGPLAAYFHGRQGVQGRIARALLGSRHAADPMSGVH